MGLFWSAKKGARKIDRMFDRVDGLTHSDTQSITQNQVGQLRDEFFVLTNSIDYAPLIVLFPKHSRHFRDVNPDVDIDLIIRKTLQALARLAYELSPDSVVVGSQRFINPALFDRFIQLSLRELEQASKR